MINFMVYWRRSILFPGEKQLLLDRGPMPNSGRRRKNEKSVVYTGGTMGTQPSLLQLINPKVSVFLPGGAVWSSCHRLGFMG